MTRFSVCNRITLMKYKYTIFVLSTQEKFHFVAHVLFRYVCFGNKQYVINVLSLVACKYHLLATCLLTIIPKILFISSLHVQTLQLVCHYIMTAMTWLTSLLSFLWPVSTTCVFSCLLTIRS
jgi:hypothetical protein